MAENRKSFEIKAYLPDGTLVRTVRANERMSDVSFSWQLNGGQGVLAVELNVPFADTQYRNGMFLKAYAYDDAHPNGKAVFCGQVSKATRTFSEGSEGVKLEAVGLGAVLSAIRFSSGGSYAFTKNQTVGQTVKDAVDSFNAQFPGGWLSYGVSDVEAGPTANLAFDSSTCLEAVQKCAEVSGYFWTVTAEGVVKFFQNSPTGTHHKFDVGGEARELVADEDMGEIANRYRLTYASGTVTVNDTASQALYGVWERHETDTSILDVGTANTRAAAFLAKNSVPVRKIRATIGAEYSFPGGSIEDVVP